MLMQRDPSAQGTTIAVEGEEVSISADGELVRAMVLNLLINAAHALAGKGRIDIRLERRGDQAVLEIRDSGPGIPPEIRGQVFEPFFTTKARGGGLGLPIARRTAELHGGSLALECPDEGGTVVTVTLPLRPSLPPVAPAEDADQARSRPESMRT
jgi:signal transduction histidine kinase